MAHARAFVSAVKVVDSNGVPYLTGTYVLFDGTTQQPIVPVYPGAGDLVGVLGGQQVAGDPVFTYDSVDWQEVITEMIQGPNHENDDTIRVIFLS